MFSTDQASLQDASLSLVPSGRLVGRKKKKYCFRSIGTIGVMEATEIVSVDNRELERQRKLHYSLRIPFK